MGKFVLMNKDTKVADLICEKNQLTILRIYNNVDMNYIAGTDTWIKSRLTPFGRANIQKLLNLAKLNNLESYTKVTKAISLNDTLWINDCEKPVSWAEINPYKNKFSRVISEIALAYNYTKGDLRSPSPEYQTEGAFNKCWKRIDGSIYLIKGGSEKIGDSTGNESYSEVLACQVAKTMGLNSYVEYRLREDYKLLEHDLGHRAYCICKSFTNEKVGFIPYKNLEMEELHKLMTSYTDKRKLLEMLLFDSVILNVDRHTGNFGFLINNDTRTITKFAPIFDNNYSLLPRLSIRDRNREEITSDVNSAFPKTTELSFIQQGKLAIYLDKSLKENLKRLKDFEFDITGMKYFSKERAKFLSSLVRYQAKKILR